MEVESLGSLPVASLWWRMGGGAWTLAVVCKGTLELTPGELRLAARQDPILADDRYVGGDRDGSLQTAADLPPCRPMVDVTVVGRAFAPEGRAVDSLTPRLRVGELDKSLTVVADRSGGRGRQSPFAAATLGYELAAGGPGTPNPVGVPAGANRRAVRMVPVGTSPTATAEIPTVGFGPIAPHWPGRQRLLQGKPAPPPTKSGGELTLPADFDLRYFNAAPSDQQLKSLVPGTELVLEHLHPSEPTLQTRLPRLSPQVFVLRSDGGKHEQLATIDALWLDTSRAIATVTWRSQFEFARRSELRKVWVVITEAGKRMTWERLSKLVDTLGAPLTKPPRSPAGPPEPPRHRRRSERPPADASWPAPPRDEGAGGIPDLAGEPDGEDSLDETQALRIRTATARPRDDDTQTEITRTASVLVTPFANAGLPGDGSPSWLASPGSAEGAPDPPPPSTGGGGPADPSAGQLEAQPLFATTANGPAQPSLGTLPNEPPAPAPSNPGLAAVRPPTPSWLSATGFPIPREESTTDTASLPRLDLSKHYADREAAMAADRDVIELLWFDEEATARVRQQWRELTAELEFSPLDRRHDLPAADPQEARDRHTNFGVLTEARATNAAGLSAALRDAISETGRFTPPLVVIGGRLHFPFDDLEILRATAATLTPLAGDDKKLTEALGNVKELLDTPLLQHSNELVDNFTKHLRKIYGQSKRALSRDYLDTTVERMLLEQRRYQKRTIFDGEWIRALLTPSDGGDAIVAYLPESLEKTLPMMVSFETRMIVEAHVRQDQFEPHPHALRVVALGRVLELGRGA